VELLGDMEINNSCGGLLPGSGRSLHELILDDYAEREARVLGAPLTPSSPSSPPPRCGG
jgi:hypothetical protein